MLLADSNIWLALTLSAHEFHLPARNWFSDQSRRGSVVFCRATQQSFLRLLTTRSVFASYAMNPMGNKKAWSVYESFVADRRVGWADDPRDLDHQWKKWTSNPMPSPKLWMDAYLAAFASTGKFQLVTTDRGFRQFDGIDLLLLPKD